MGSLFAVTLFVSAFLLFWVQLMVAKMILPLLGGSPSVWNTCLFFFQFTLLVGYGYAHLTTIRGNLRYQAILHIGLLALPLVLLPIALPPTWNPPPDANPILWLLTLLARSVGLPFLMISTSAPLLQKWFVQIKHSGSQDPYVLYAASNLGSLLGLISYPLLIEPTFSLTQQSGLWAGGYALLLLLTLICAVQLWRSPNAPKAASSESKVINSQSSETDIDGPNLSSHSPIPPLPSPFQQAQWVVLAFLPSSLLLGVTTYLTTDIASIPFLWAVPLALYLLTFVLAFARKPQLPPALLVTLLPLIFTALMGLSLLQVTQPIWLVLPLHLSGFFIAAFLFHSELSRTRPAAAQLTVFYFWVSVGGVLGGWFNAIAAPLLFPTVLEYPLILLLSLMLLQRFSTSDGGFAGLRLTLPLSAGLLLGGLLIGFNPQFLNYQPLGGLLAVGLTIAIAVVFALHPARLMVGLLLVVLLGQFSLSTLGGVLATDRSFFGVYRVLQSRNETLSLLQGTTLHGKQSLDPERRREPLTYFYPTGPIGQMFQAFEPQRFARVAVLGLGIGTLAAYAHPGQQWTFYEIDPIDEKLAQRYFTFLQDSPAAVNLMTGDARLAIQAVPDHTYDLLVMDAFTSDSIPIHLVTREAIQLYLSKLTQQGLLVINISNRYLNLEPILGALAEDLGLSTLRQREATISDADRNLGKSPSHWVVLANQAQDLGALRKDSRWQPIVPSPTAPLWTDDFSDIFRVLKAFRRSTSVSPSEVSRPTL